MVEETNFGPMLEGLAMFALSSQIPATPRTEHPGLDEELYYWTLMRAPDVYVPPLGPSTLKFLDGSFMHYPNRDFLAKARKELKEMEGMTPTILRQLLELQRVLRCNFGIY
jgi:hypothetical protein